MKPETRKQWAVGSGQSPVTGIRYRATPRRGLRFATTSRIAPRQGVVSASLRHRVSRIVTLTLLLVLASSAFAQQGVSTVIDPQDAALRAQFREADFGGNLAIRVAGDPVKEYYVVDMNRFVSRFERIWFINLVFQSAEVVTLDHDIAADQMWFFAPKRLPEEKALALFDEMKRSADSVSNGMTEEEKAAWLQKNDKYKNNGNDEE